PIRINARTAEGFPKSIATGEKLVRRLSLAGLLNYRQVPTGQDRRETGCHIKAHSRMPWAKSHHRRTSDTSETLPLAGVNQVCDLGSCQRMSGSGVAERMVLATWPSLAGAALVVLEIAYHSSSGLSINPWLSTTLPSCVIGT
ncbi:MAG: hypothetical protein ACXWC0_20325, partial [Burkholderiales bacterium]